ncbi:MAG: hypothetical protein ACLT98_10305 [Eggerthellaceae bacterium]
MKTSDLGGLDSLLSMVQMPSACWPASPSTARRTRPSWLQTLAPATPTVRRSSTREVRRRGGVLLERQRAAGCDCIRPRCFVRTLALPRSR